MANRSRLSGVLGRLTVAVRERGVVFRNVDVGEGVGGTSAARGILQISSGTAPHAGPPKDPGAEDGMAAELTLHLRRVLPAPPALVFRMHVEPDLLAQWWGPKGFSVPSVELDVRVGGSYRIAMRPPSLPKPIVRGCPD